MNRREMLATVAALGVAPAARAQAPGDIKAAVREAWIYGLPLIEMATTRARALAAPGAAQNRFLHARQLAGPESRAVTTPNNDTLYSSAWLDLTQGPVTLTIPPTGARYISVAGMSMYTNNDFILGTRTTGGEGGTYMIVGPGQAGSGRNVVRLATPHGWLLARVLVEGPEDLAAVHAVQDGLRLVGPAGSPPRAYSTRRAPTMDYFASLGDLLRSDPPPASDRAVLRRSAWLTGVGGMRATSETLAQIDAGVQDARAAVRGGSAAVVVQGWAYPRSNLGNFGQDYLFRAAVALGGLAALPPKEAMYLNPVGERGRMFVGPGPYRLHFPPGQLPPVDAFWSLTMYEATPDGQLFLVANPAARYSIGDRTPGLRKNADGSLDVWIARANPGGEKSANWLPAPASGPFTVTLRAYLPRRELLDGRYRLPPITEG